MPSDDCCRKIRRLESTVSSAIRAASVLSSLHRVVEELVMNSLDASSSKIEVVVDFTTWSVIVNDNGMRSIIGYIMACKHHKWKNCYIAARTIIKNAICILLKIFADSSDDNQIQEWVCVTVT